MSLIEPVLAEPASPDDFARQAAERVTPYAEYAGAKLLGGIEATRPVEAYGLASLPSRYASDEYGLPPPGPPPSDLLTKEQFDSGPYKRPNLEYEEGETEARAAARAAVHDRNAYRDSLVARSDTGWLGQAAGFGLGLGAAALDPTNYIPLVGPASKAAMVARFGRIGGALLGHGADAALNTGLFEPLAATTAQAEGRSYGWEEAGSDILMNALGGALLGTAAGEAARALGFGHPADAGRHGAGRDISPTLQDTPPTLQGAPEPGISGLAAPPEAAAGASLDDMARRRGGLEGQIMGGMGPDPWGPFDVMPYDELRLVVERDGAALADVQAHGIAGANPEHQLDALLTGGIDKGRAFHTGPLGASGDLTVRAAGLGAKVEAPYVLLAAPGERMKEGGIRAVVVNGAAKGNLDDLKARYPGVTFLAPDEVAGWAKGDHAAAPPEVGAGVVPRRAGQPPLRVDDLMRRADAADLALDQLDRGEPVDVGKVLASDPAVRAEEPRYPPPSPEEVARRREVMEALYRDGIVTREEMALPEPEAPPVYDPEPARAPVPELPDGEARQLLAEEQTLVGGRDRGGRMGEATKARLDEIMRLLPADGEQRVRLRDEHLMGVAAGRAATIKGQRRGRLQGGRALPGDADPRGGVGMSLATAAPEPVPPTLAEAAPRVGKAVDELAALKQDAGLAAYEKPLPGHEPKPEPVPGEPAKPEKVPTAQEKAAATAALPPELQEIEHLRREGVLLPEDEAALAAAEATAQRAEGYAAGWQALASCVLRNLT